MLIFRLFWEFFKTGLFAIGGGLQHCRSFMICRLRQAGLRWMTFPI